MKLKLFDKMITPILLYGSEVLEIYCVKEIAKLHINFVNIAVCGELGRFPYI